MSATGSEAEFLLSISESLRADSRPPGPVRGISESPTRLFDLKWGMVLHKLPCLKAFGLLQSGHARQFSPPFRILGLESLSPPDSPPFDMRNCENECSAMFRRSCAHHCEITRKNASMFSYVKIAVSPLLGTIYSLNRAHQRHKPYSLGCDGAFARR